MTGWRTDEAIMAFADNIKQQIAARPDLMPDAWYWISIDIENDLLLQELKTRVLPIEDPGYLAWIKSDPERLAKNLNSKMNLRQAYVDLVAALDVEIDLLS